MTTPVNNTTDISSLTAQARAAEAGGDITLAIHLWHTIVSREPDNLSAAGALAHLLLETGKPADAAKHYEPVAIAAMDNDDVQRTFLDLLLAAGETERARRHADFADLRKDGRAFRAYIDAILASPEDAPASLPGAQHHPDLSRPSTHASDGATSPSLDPIFSHDHAVHLATVFQGRSDAFARQWLADDGSTGYAPVYKPYSPRIVLNHLLGNFTTGIYLTRPDGHARILAFDLDITPDAIASARGSVTRAAELRHIVTQYACEAAAAFRMHGLNPLLEDSGYKGVHIWIAFDDWSPAARLRRLGQCLLATLPPPPDTISVEIFPKQKGNPVKLGNLIKLPLGIHRKTGRRSVLLDHSGNPYHDQAAALLAFKPTPAQIILHLLDKLNLPPEASPCSQQSDSAAAPHHPRDTATPPAAFPTLSDAEFDAEPALSFLLSRCATLNTLVRRIRTSRRVSYDERLIIEHTLGHLPNGPAIVNFLLRPCENFDSRFLMRRPHRGCPVSCSKIIARIPYIAETNECQCVFSSSCANYPTPLNHLYSFVPETAPQPALPPPTSHPATNNPSPPNPPSPRSHAPTAFDVANILKRLTSFIK